MTTQTLTPIVIIAVLIVAVFITAFRLFKTFYLLKEVKTRLNLETEQKEHYKKKLAASPTRQEFIEQSEIATEWRQKHDKLKESFDSQKDYMERTAASWNKLSNEVAQLEAELDRGNEMITWMKADLQKAYTLLFVNENNIMQLLAEGKFPDEKGIYRENYISKNGEDLPLGQYIDSLHDSLISQLELSNKRNSVEKIKELDHLFKNPFREKKPKGWNLKVYPRDEKGRVRKASDFMYKEFEPKPVKGIDHQLRSSEGDEELGRTLVSHDMLVHTFQDNKFDIPERGPAETNHDNAVLEHIQEIITEQKGAIDWSKPQPFPNGYEIPSNTRICLTEDHFRGQFLKGIIGTTIDKNSVPDVKLDNGQKYPGNSDCYMHFHSNNLAPLDPTDHPLHPDFNPSKYEA